MKQAVEDERLIKQYLLGELADEQQSHVQDRLLTDPEVFKLLLLLENELADEYLSSELSQSERERFNSYFLSAPEHRQKLKFAKALNKYASAAASQRSQSPADTVSLSWWRSLGDFFRSQNRMLVVSLATASLVLAAVGVSLVVLTGTYEVARVRDENATEPGASASKEQTPATVPHRNQTSQDISKLKTETPPAASPAVKSLKTSPSQHEQKQEPERALIVKPPPPPTTEETRSTPSSPSPRDIQNVQARAGRAQEELAREAAPKAAKKSFGAIVDRALAPKATLFESLTLTQGMVRDVSATKTAEITAATQRLLLHLALEDGDYPSYRADLKTAKGKDIEWSQDELKSRQTPSGKALMVSVPAKLLVSGDYIVTLSGTADDGEQHRAGTYHFRVVRK